MVEVNNIKDTRNMQEMRTPLESINRKNGCPSCAGNARWTFNKFINEAILIHGESIDYTEVKEESIKNVRKLHYFVTYANID